MKLKRDGNMIVDENGAVVCLMCECDSFGGLHTAFNADENARIIISAVAFQAANDRQYNIGPQTMERVFEAAGLTNMSDLQAVMDAVEKALVSKVKPLEWKGKRVKTAFAEYFLSPDGKRLTILTNQSVKTTRHDDEAAARKAAQEHHEACLSAYIVTG